MFLTKKKRLWRARVKLTAAIAATPNQQQPRRHHQRPHHLQQSNNCGQSQSQQRNGKCSTIPGYCDQQNMTIDNRNYCNQNYQNPSSYYGADLGNRKLMEMDWDCHDTIITNCGENSNDCNEEDCDQTMSSMSTTASNIALMSQSQRLHSQQELRDTQQLPPPSSPTIATTTVASLLPITSMASTMATTAANVFRNCCGSGCLSTDSISSLSCNFNNNNNNNFSSNNNNFSSSNNRKNRVEKFYTRAAAGAAGVDTQKEMFNALVKNLTEIQLSTLLQAVEKRSTGANVGHQPDCVLVSRDLKMEKEPNLFACQLWLWPDLTSSTELKRIPSCPNEIDPVYVCCNPTHYSRICLTDTPPPPYQPLAMEGLNHEDRAPSESLKDGGNTNTSTSSSTGIRSQFQGSLTTDGEDSRSPSLTWCQLAYWELSKRIGSLFAVDKTSVNVFSDQPHGDGLCLKTLAQQRPTVTPESVIKARKKIGLGITLSQEDDGVWLYNRSSNPVFVHSPTLNDIEFNSFFVSKVLPGYCILAFDSKRARTQSQRCPSQIAGSPTGPIDKNSMRISFAKGWGQTYTRREVIACPCWLEVLFTRR